MLTSCYIHTYIFINPRSRVTIKDTKTVSDKVEKKLNYLQHINIYIALQYCLMVGKAFAWKTVTDSALTADMGRLIQRGMASGKNENLYALVRTKMCLNL